MGDTLGYRVLKKIDPQYIKDKINTFIKDHPNVVDLSIIVDWLGDCIYIDPAEVNGYHYNFCTIVNVKRSSSDSVKDINVKVMEGICQQAEF